MAEGMARAYASKRGQLVEARSCGVLGIEGRAADPTAMRVMGEIGVDLGDHRSRGIDAEQVAWADYILGMELMHSAEVRKRFPEAEEKTMLLGNFGGFFEIPDPLGGWRWRFRRCRDQIQTCVTAFMDQLPPRVL